MRSSALLATLLLSISLSSAQADRLSLTATGLPAGLSAKVTVGKQTVPTNQALTLSKGTYTVIPSAVTDGRKVYVASPVRVTVKGNSTARITYTKLAPGSLDPFFGKDGAVETKTPGLKISDSWTLAASGVGLPIVTMAGSFSDIKAQVLSATGTPLGSITNVGVKKGLLAAFYSISPMIQDGDGYLLGLGSTKGSVVRLNAKGQFDANWKTNPEEGISVRGLLRLPDKSILAYGGNTSPALWKLDASGKSVTTFGTNGTLDLASLDPNMKQGSVVVAAQPIKDGKVRLATIKDNRLALIDTTADGQASLVAPSAELPLDTKQPYKARNVVVAQDGSAFVLAANSVKKRAQLWRIAADGTVDTQFRSPVLEQVSHIAGLVIQQDGKPVIAVNDAKSKGQVIRFTTNGSLDTTFGKGGKVSLPVTFADLTTDANGKLRVISTGLGEALKPDSAFVRITQLLTE